MNLFNYEPEKFWQFPTTWPKEKQRQEFKAAVISNRYLASEKIDGHWHRIVVQDGILKIQSRGISTVTGEYGDHTEHLPHIVEIFKQLNLKDTMIIGEMYLPGKKDRDMTTIFGCLPEKAVKRQEGNPVLFRIVDCLYLDGVSLMTTPFEKRIQTITDKVNYTWNQIPNFKKYITVAHQYQGEGIVEILAEILEQGGEGIVLVDKMSLPTPGKRTARKTIKIKAELSNDIDVFLTGKIRSHTRKYNGLEIESWKYWINLKSEEKLYGDYFEEYAAGKLYEPITKGFYYGWPGSLEIAVLRDGEVFPLGYISNLTEKIKEDYIKDDGWQYKVARVSGMEFTPDKQIRHPKFLGFRDDIPYTDCTYDKIFG